MSAPSISVVAAAAIGTCSHSYPSSTSTDHVSFHLFPYNANPIKTPSKLRTSLNYSPFSSLSRFPVSCVWAAFDSADLNQEEDIEGTVLEVEEANEVPESGRLYVGNLPFSMTSSQLSEIFAEAGRVVSVEIVYDKVTYRSRGFAFINMGSVEEAKEAIRLFDGGQIGGRSAKVNFPEVPKGGEKDVRAARIRDEYDGHIDSPHELYAGNLSWFVTSRGLREAFQEQPGFLSAKVIYDKDYGKSRGFGFIAFSSAEAAESAMNAMNEVELEGRPLRLKIAGQRDSASPPAAVEMS